MVREISDGGWTLPGGWADVNQTARECVEREIREESGFEARAFKLAAVYDYQRQRHRRAHPYSIYKMFFLCELTGGAARAQHGDQRSRILRARCLAAPVDRTCDRGADRAHVRALARPEHEDRI
jgi:ADP-ribose pyrophosphatase YjhB (NUDIX family)